MHQFSIPFSQKTANLITLLGGDNPEFKKSIKAVTLVGVKNAEGEELETSHIGFKGGPIKREASGYTVDVGPFLVRADYQSGEIELWGQEFQDLMLVLGIELKR
jgi:hypothetical protein